MCVVAEERLEEVLFNLKSGRRPFGGEMEVDSEGEVIEKIEGVEVVDNEKVDPDRLLIHYVLKRRWRGDKWGSYPYTMFVDRPANVSRTRMALMNGGFPYGIVDDVLKAADMGRQAVKMIQGFLEDDNAVCYTMAGECGEGKTFAAVWAASRLIKEKKAKTCGFVKASDADGYMRTGNTAHLPEVPDRNVDVLVIDDLCAEIVTSVIKAQLSSLVDYRLNRKLTTILTTNIQDREEIVELYGRRMESRLTSRDCSLFECMGEGGEVLRLQPREEGLDGFELEGVGEEV